LTFFIISCLLALVEEPQICRPMRIHTNYWMVDKAGMCLCLFAVLGMCFGMELLRILGRFLVGMCQLDRCQCLIDKCRWCLIGRCLIGRMKSSIGCLMIIGLLALCIQYRAGFQVDYRVDRCLGAVRFVHPAG